MIKYICDHCGNEAPVGDIYTLTANRPIPLNDLIMAKALSDKHICRDCLLGLWRKPTEEVVVTSKTKRIKPTEPDSEKPEKAEKEPEPEKIVPEPDTVAKMLTLETPEKPKKRGKLEPGKHPEKEAGLPKERMDELTGKNLKRRFYLTKEDEPVIRERYRNGEEIEQIANEMGLDFACVSVFIANEGLGKERYAGQAIPDRGGQPVMPVTTGVYHVKGGR